MSSRRIEVLLFIETSRAYGRGVIKGIAQYAHEQGNWSLFFEDRSLYDPIPAWVKQWKGDGIITRTTTPSQLRDLSELRVPRVEMFGSIAPEVGCDDAILGRMASEHFISKGMHHFAFFSPEMPWWCRNRFECFEQFLALYGYTCHCFERKRKATQRLSPGWNVRDDTILKEWLLSLPKPIGLFAATDSYSLTVLGACRRYGIDVPNQVAILGTDNDVAICHSVTPQLSSIDVNSTLTGYTAASLLHQRMQKKRTPIKTPIFISPAYVVTRQSTDIIAIPDEDIIEAISFLRKHAVHGVTVGKIAEHVGLSLSTLNRRFRKYFGQSPKNEIVKCKIDEAKRFLRETRLPVHLIAKRSGFEPPEYFVRAFKREVGLTPLQYRKTFLASATVDEK